MASQVTRNTLKYSMLFGLPKKHIMSYSLLAGLNQIEIVHNMFIYHLVILTHNSLNFSE